MFFSLHLAPNAVPCARHEVAALWAALILHSFVAKDGGLSEANTLDK
jgi:hypothetical protein